MTEKEYHALKYLSNSGISKLLECPALYRDWLFRDEDENVQTEAMSFGSAFHKFVLEPHEFDKEYAVTDLSFSTTEGKKFKKENEGKKFFKEDVYNTLLLMREAVYTHPQAKLFFQSYEAEVPLFWTEQDVLCKAKLDMISTLQGNTYILDLKTCQSVNPVFLEKHIASYGYYRQAYFYQRALQALDREAEDFFFIFIEKTSPYLITMVKLDDEAILQGQKECDRAIATFKECLEKKEFPCYTRKIKTLSLPKWARKEI